MSLPNAHVDMESFSELNVKNVGGCRYAEHPSTEVLCMGWVIGPDEEPELWMSEKDPYFSVTNAHQDPPEPLFDHVAAGGLVWAWNAEFEIPMWREVCVKRMGWPPIPLEQWRDSAALALSFALPANLEDAGHALGLDEEMVKDDQGHRVMLKLCKPRRPSKHNPATRWTIDAVPQDYEALYSYCRQDVRSERAVQRALPLADLPPAELKTWRMTVEMNLRGWTVDLDSTRRMLDLMAEHKVGALKELRALTHDRVQTAGQLDKIREWLTYWQGVELPDLKAETVVEALVRENLPSEARRVLEIRQELGRAATNKYEAQKTRACDDGTVKNNIMYHGAGTGRDAGRGIQIQNYLREGISKTEAGVATAYRALWRDDPASVIEMVYGSVPRFAALMTRSMLIAAPGKVLYCGDYSSIENKISAWYAGCEYALDIFRKGLDEYKVFGSRYYKVDYDAVTTPQRDHSKRAVLLLVFGGGWETFQKQAAQYGDPCTEDEAKETVRFYREDLYPEVVAMWRALERAAKAAIRKPGRITTVQRPYARIRFQVKHDFLLMRLASGRNLAYHRPRIQKMETPWGAMRDTITHMGVDSRTRKWTRLKLIPGRIFENVVQATARDVMMAGAHATIGAGYELVGRVHDELVNQCAKGTGDLDEYLGLMCPGPQDLPWLTGVPITAGGWTGKRYRKD